MPNDSEFVLVHQSVDGRGNVFIGNMHIKTDRPLTIETIYSWITEIKREHPEYESVVVLNVIRLEVSCA